MSGPDFDELVGPDVPAAERERLRRAHEALLAAGPPPELSPAVSAPPPVEPPGRLFLLPRRRRFATALVAVAAAAAVFLVAFLVGRASKPDPFRLVRGPVEMHGTALAPAAVASIAIGPKDASGNWPMVMHVRGLPQLPAGREYELFLSRKGLPVDLCTSFRVHGGRTDVWFNAPYPLASYDGWVVIVRPAGAGQEPPVVMTT